jgi:hypothetical protein
MKGGHERPRRERSTSLRAILPTSLAAVGLVLFAWIVAAAAEGGDVAPLPEAPEVDAAKAALGRFLFFDERLSGDTGNSCATCHDPATGWGDGQALSDGYSGVLYFRNAPGLFNVAARRYLMWDARVDGSDLATAVRDMITEAHTHTMNMDTRLAQEPLKQVPEYVSMFEAAFGPGDPYGGKIYSAAASASVQASTSPALPQLSHRLRPLPVGSAGRIGSAAGGRLEGASSGSACEPIARWLGQKNLSNRCIRLDLAGCHRHRAESLAELDQVRASRRRAMAPAIVMPFSAASL